MSAFVRELFVREIKGGEGSGNFGHEGRPGEVGGSGEGGDGGGGGQPRFARGEEIANRIRNTSSVSTRLRIIDGLKTPEDRALVMQSFILDARPGNYTVSQLADELATPGTGAFFALHQDELKAAVLGYVERFPNSGIRANFTLDLDNIVIPSKQKSLCLSHRDMADSLMVEEM